MTSEILKCTFSRFRFCAFAGAGAAEAVPTVEVDEDKEEAGAEEGPLDSPPLELLLLLDS
jgi:hypothetical protein